MLVELLDGAESRNFEAIYDAKAEALKARHNAVGSRSVRRMRYSHFAHIADPGIFRRVLSPDQAERVVQMKERGLTFGAIAAGSRETVLQVSYQAVREAYRRTARKAA
jgi:hypothetical protein